jgi:uncharacterized membrane protein
MPEEKKSNVTDPDVEQNKAIACLSYIWILFLVPLLAKRDSKFAQFHAKQGLILFIVEIIGSLVFWIPFIGWLLWLGLVIIAIIGIIKALNGEWWKMPYIYDWSKKINI